METILGIVMIYAWVHSTVIIARKLVGTTSYEKVVLYASLTAFVLYIIGTLTN